MGRTVVYLHMHEPELTLPIADPDSYVWPSPFKSSPSVGLPNKRSYAAVALLAIAQFAVVPLLHLDVLRVRWVLFIAAGIDAYLALPTWRASGPRERFQLAAFFGIPVCVVLALSGPSLYDVSKVAILLLAGWSVPLAVLRWDPQPSSAPGVVAKWLTASWLVLATAAWVVARPPGHHPIILDEVLYLIQSRYVLHPPFMRPLEGDLAPFFLINQSYYVPGYFNGQYPPGWPLLLSIASSLSASWLLLFAVYGLLVGTTYVFGRVVAGARVGLLAAVLVTASAPILDFSTTFFTHVFEAALGLIAASLMVGRVGASPGRRTWAWALAGLTLGFAVAVRPLTGLALAATLWFWVLLRERPTLRAATATTLAACAGAVAPVVFVLYYNLETTGSALRFGYDVAEHGLHALGFGMRGFVEYAAMGVPVEHAYQFGPLVAVKNLRETVRAGLTDFFSATILIVPIAYAAWRAGVRWRWRPLGAFVVLPLAYGFYFYHSSGSDRFYVEILPFALVGSAYLLHGLARRHRTAGAVLAGLLATTMIVDAASDIRSRRRDYTRLTASQTVVERLRVDHQKLLVFVRSTLPQPPGDTISLRWWGEPAMAPLFGYDVFDFPSDVVVVRDLGDRDTLAAQRFPGRYNVLLSVRLGANGGYPSVIEAREFDPGESSRAP